MRKMIASISIALGLMFAIGTNVNAATVHYKDVKESDNFYPSVQYLLDQKAISRTLPQFRPYENITRGQVASILAKVLDDRLKEIEYTEWYSGANFIDVPKTDQFYPYVNKLDWNGIMRGYYVNDTSSSARAFGINQPLTRGQFAGVIIKAYEIPLIQLQSYKESGASPSDIFDGKNFTYPWGQEIATLQTTGILSGYDDGNFKPSTPIKRSQFANMLVKAANGELYFFNQNNLLNDFEQLGISKETSMEKIKTLTNNTTVKYLASYRDVRYLNAVTIAIMIYKEGVILFEDINVKMAVSKDANGKWQLNVEKIN